MPVDPNTGQPLPYPSGGAGAPPASGEAALEMMEIPPHIAAHIDPNNQMQMTLLQRVDKLTDQDGQALMTGLSPQAAAVLKKIIPELGFAIDMIHEQGEAAAPGGMPAAPQPGGGAPMPPKPQPQFSAPRPTTKLGAM